DGELRHAARAGASSARSGEVALGCRRGRWRPTGAAGRGRACAAALARGRRWPPPGRCPGPRGRRSRAGPGIPRAVAPAARAGHRSARQGRARSWSAGASRTSRGSGRCSPVRCRWTAGSSRARGAPRGCRARSGTSCRRGRRSSGRCCRRRCRTAPSRHTRGPSRGRAARCSGSPPGSPRRRGARAVSPRRAGAGHGWSACAKSRTVAGYHGRLAARTGDRHARPDHSFARFGFRSGRHQDQRAGRLGRGDGLAHAAAGFPRARRPRLRRGGGAARGATVRGHRRMRGAAGAGGFQHGRIRLRAGLAGSAGRGAVPARHAAGGPRLRAGARASGQRAHAADPRLARRAVSGGRRAGLRRASPAAPAAAGRRPSAAGQHGHDRRAVRHPAGSTGMSRWFATCPKGMEYLLRDELVQLGATEVREALAGVHFEGPLTTAYRACLWSRLASRILLPLAEFDAATDDALYAGVQAIDWSTHLAAHATLAVDAHTALSKLTHSQFIAQRVKDAVVDQFRQQGGTRPGVDTDEPDVRLNLRLKRDRATLSLDLAGSPLHRRGWREVQGEAPLKENLAAAMLLRARWPEVYAQGGALLDPMCGSGTLLVEGALMAADVAPGWRRDYYGFLGWQQHDLALWRSLLDEARQRAETGLKSLRPCFFGSDADPRMVQTAKRNAQEAGVAGFLTLEKRDVAHVEPPAGVERGLVITNPPYGERLGERAQMPALYHALGERLRTQFPGWRAAVLAGDAELGRALGLHAEKKYALYNGALETQLLTFEIRARDAAPREPKPLSAGAQMLK